MPRLRKTLPKDLEQLFEAAAETGDDGSVRAALEKCLPDARGGYGKATVLSQRGCTAAIAQFAIERGTDINAGDTYGRAPIHEAAGRRWGAGLSVQQVLDLGADPHLRCRHGRTALHYAADSQHFEAVQTLLRQGLDPTAQGDDGQTAMEWALQRMSNTAFVGMVPVAKSLLEAGDVVSERAQGYARTAAERFEFHRERFNKESVEETSAAMEELCALMGVMPPAPRRRHDGVSPIVATAPTWQKAHRELWDLLVPSGGPCETVQGEVIRVTGRISDELYRNGGGNWDRDYRAMVNALIGHLGSGVALSVAELAEAKRVASALLEDTDGSRRLAEFAVAWVALNPDPVSLAPPTYHR